ncbi:MAG: CSLREA domain-containing protein, partial [Planctomycetales bacterium]
MKPEWLTSFINSLTSTKKNNPRSQRRLSIEPLEPRCLLTALTVNSLDDNTLAADGQVTLREAIIAANTDALTDLGQTGSGADQISFDSNLFPANAGPQTLSLSGTELAITSAMTI